MLLKLSNCILLKDLKYIAELFVGLPGMKFLTEFSVKNSLIVNVLSVLILIAGLISLSQLNREAFPNIEFDIVTVTTMYPSSTPQEVEKLITIPLEKELKSVDEIDEITSVSSEGISLISLKINEDVSNKQAIINDIQRAVDQADDLPSDLPNSPLVRDIKTKDTPVIEISLSGDLPEEELRRYALALEKKILDQRDVSAVKRNGLRDKEIWVQLTPESMTQNHVGLTEVIRALSLQNTTLPGGKFYDESNREYILKTSGAFENKDDVARTVVRASTLGEWIRVGDIALVEDKFAEETIINKTRGTRSINLVVIKRAKGDSIRLVDDIKVLASDFLKTAPSELEISYINDLSFYIRRRLNVLINNGVVGLVLVAISLFLFLSVGTAIGACIGIPTALLLTFSLMNGFDISINLLSLFGLIMVLGMLVDEDIVIAENVYRHIEDEHEDVKTAAINGANEVSTPVVATALTTIAAFIPIYFMGGIMGKFTQHIPTIIIITLAASLVEAIIILPSHVSDITLQLRKFSKRFRKTEHKRPAKGHAMLERILKVYQKVLRNALRFRYLYLLGLMLAFGGSMALAAKNIKKFQLFPKGGVEIFFIRAEGTVGDSLQRTSEKLKPLEEIVQNLPKNELDTYATQVGIMRDNPNDPMTKRGSHLAQIAVYLTPEADRDRSAKQITEAVREQAKKVKGFQKINFDEVRSGPPTGKPVQVRILGDDYATMELIAERFVAELKKIDGVSDAKDDYDLDKDEIQVKVDAVQAAQMGLTLQDIALTVRYAFEGAEATTIKSSEEEIGVVVKFPPRFRSNQKALENLLIQNSAGRLIPLSRVASLNKEKTVRSIIHFDTSRNINVTANIDPMKIGSLEVMNQLKKRLAPFMAKYPNYRAVYGGEGQDTQESLENLKQAFYLAVGLILFILITMFRSLIQPLIIVFTIPFTIIGVIVAFELHDKNLNFMAILGIVGLTGVVVDAGIILIDFINKYRKAGMSLQEAIVKGSLTRFRAIVLITFTTALGLVPAAYGIGGSDPFIAPMAMALNYGMVFSTVLTLIYIPIFMVVLDDIGRLFKRLPFVSE